MLLFLHFLMSYHSGLIIPFHSVFFIFFDLCVFFFIKFFSLLSFWLFSFSSFCKVLVILGLCKEAINNYNLLSHILLIFKYYIYISRKKRTLSIDILIANLIKVKKREEKISIVTINKRETYKKVVHYR